LDLVFVVWSKLKGFFLWESLLRLQKRLAL